MASLTYLLKKITINITQKLDFVPKIQSTVLIGLKILFNLVTLNHFHTRIAFCPICSKNRRILVDSINLRESNYCFSCFGNSRYKAMGSILKKLIQTRIRYYNTGIIDKNLEKIVNIKENKIPLRKYVENCNYMDFIIYEPDSRGTIHNSLKKFKGYIFSEYFPNCKKNILINGIQNEDLQDLSYRDSSIDILITQDVFEHIKNPRKAFNEIYRVLKPGGFHVFTTPIHTIPETLIDENDNVLKFPIIYHGDHTNNQGAKVYTNFGKDIIEELKKMDDFKKQMKN